MGKKHEVHEEHENHERWLVSYADFITLLFAFFVVMYSVSRTDTSKAAKAEKSIQWAMHYEGTGGIGQMPIFDGPASAGSIVSLGASGGKKAISQTAVESMRRRVEQRVKALIVEQSANGQGVQVLVEGGRLTLRLATAHFFDPASAAIRPEALPTLDALAKEMAAFERPLRIEGHTDDEPISGKYRNNWELSAARAATVAAFLEQSHEVKPELLTAAGFGSTRPVAKNDTPEGREANRRLEISIELNPNDPMGLTAH
jgi:chemotaxis protein MotB